MRQDAIIRIVNLGSCVGDGVIAVVISLQVYHTIEDRSDVGLGHDEPGLAEPFWPELPAESPAEGVDDSDVVEDAEGVVRWSETQSLQDPWDSFVRPRHPR